MGFWAIFWKNIKLCVITIFAFAAFFGIAAGMAFLMIKAAEVSGWAIVMSVFIVLVILIIAGGSALIDYFNWR